MPFEKIIGRFLFLQGTHTDLEESFTQLGFIKTRGVLHVEFIHESNAQVSAHSVHRPFLTADGYAVHAAFQDLSRLIEAGSVVTDPGPLQLKFHSAVAQDKRSFRTQDLSSKRFICLWLLRVKVLRP